MRLATFSALLLLIAGCGSRGTPPPIPSPDGSMTLHTRIERSKADLVTYLCVIFEIRDRTGRVTHTENTRASDRMRWNLSWVSNDRIRLKSSDIGTFEWKRLADGRWVKERGRKSGLTSH
jgi:hypothetical protein